MFRLFPLGLQGIQPGGSVGFGQFSFVRQIGRDVHQGQQGRFFFGLFFIPHRMSRKQNQILIAVLGIRDNATDFEFLFGVVVEYLFEFGRRSLLFLTELLQKCRRQFLPLGDLGLTDLCRLGLLGNVPRLTGSTLLFVALAAPLLGIRIPLVSSARSFGTIATKTVEGMVAHTFSS